MEQLYCKCEYCRAFQHPHHNTYLHAGAGDVWPANTEQARITRQMLTEAVEAARREGYDAGNEAGYEIGYEHGYSQGTDDGFSDGVADGYDEGYDEGFEDGFTQGFSVGHFEGFDEGFVNAERALGSPSTPEWIEGWGRV